MRVLLTQVLLFTHTVLPAPCEYSYKQFPNGIPNPSGTDAVSLSNIWAESGFLLVGGMQASQSLLATSEAQRNSDGIPFLLKQSTQGQNLFLKFYANTDAKKIVNVAYSSALTAVVTQFSSGIFSKMNQDSGEILKAIKIASIADSDGDNWAKHGATLTSDGSSVIFLSGLQIASTTNYRFEIFKLGISDLSLQKHIYIGSAISSYGHYGPAGICRLATTNIFAVAGSVQSDTTHPVGVLMVLNEDLNFVSQSQGIWKMDDSNNYIKPTEIRCQGDDIYVGHNAVPKTTPSYPHMETGTGTLASIRKFSYVPATPEVTMESFEIALSTSSEDVCDTFEIGTNFIYWACTIAQATEGTVNPFILITTFPGNVYEDAIFLNWGQSLTTSSSVGDRIKIHTSALVNGQLYFGGSALKILDSARDRFTFISNFIEADKKSGCNIQTAALTSNIDLSSHIQVGQNLVYDNFALWTDLSQTAISSAVSTLGVSSTFGEYTMDLQFQEHSTANICGSQLATQTEERVEVWRNDTSTNSFQLTYPQVRTYDVDSSTCDEDTPQVFLPDGTQVTSSTSPFAFDGSKLSFSSSSGDYFGTYEFPTLNLKVHLIDEQTWTPNYASLIAKFDSHRADEIADSRSLNIETQSVYLRSGISSGLSSFSSKSVFYAGYVEQARDYYYPKVVTVPTQFQQVAPNEPPFFNIVEDNSQESIVLGSHYLFTPPYISDDSEFTFQDIQVTKGTVTKSVQDPAFRSYFPNIEIQKRSLQALPKLMIQAVDLVPLVIQWNWAEMETTQLYSVSETFTLTFYEPALSADELRQIAYDNFMQEHIKDFEITDNNFLTAELIADSYYGEIIVQFSSDFSMPFNTIDNLQESRVTFRINGEEEVVSMRRLDMNKIVFELEFKDLYEVSDEDEISFKIHQADTFVSMTSGLTMDPSFMYLKANLVQQLTNNKYFQIKEDSKKVVKIFFMIVLAISIGTSWLSNLFSMIALAEFITLMPIVEMPYPKSTKLYFEGISGINLQFLEFKEALKGMTFSGSGHAPDKRFQLAGFDSHSFIINTADIWFIALLIFAKYIVVKFISGMSFDKKSRLDRVKKEANKFKGQVQFELLQIGYMVILLSSYLNILELNKASALEWFSSAFSILFCALLLLLPFFYAYLTRRIMKLSLYEDQEFRKVFGALYLDLDFRRGYSVAFGPVTMFMRLFFLAVIIFIPEAPEVQLAICFWIQMSLFTVLICSWPYKSAMRNIREGFMLLFSISLIGSLWSFSKGKDYETKKKGQDFFLLGSMIFFFFSFALFILDLFLYYCLTKLCKWYDSDESQEVIAMKPENDIFAYYEQDTQEIANREAEQESKRHLKGFPRYQRGLHEDINPIASPLPKKYPESNFSTLSPNAKQLRPKTLNNELIAAASSQKNNVYGRQSTNNVKVMDDIHPEENTVDMILPHQERDSALERELERIERMEKRKSEIIKEQQRRASARMSQEAEKNNQMQSARKNEGRRKMEEDEEKQMKQALKEQQNKRDTYTRRVTEKKITNAAKYQEVSDSLKEEDENGETSQEYDDEEEEEGEMDEYGEEEEEEIEQVKELKPSANDEEEEEGEEEGEYGKEENDDEEQGEDEEDGEVDEEGEVDQDGQEEFEDEQQEEQQQLEEDDSEEGEKSEEVHVQKIPTPPPRNINPQKVQMNKPRKVSESAKWANQSVNRGPSQQLKTPRNIASPTMSPRAPVVVSSMMKNPQSITSRGNKSQQKVQPKTPGIQKPKNGLTQSAIKQPQSPLFQEKKEGKQTKKPDSPKRDHIFALSSKQVQIKGSVRNQTVSPTNRPPQQPQKKVNQVQKQRKPQQSQQQILKSKKTLKKMNQAYGEGASKINKGPVVKPKKNKMRSSLKIEDEE